jgi:hypothetical protein
LKNSLFLTEVADIPSPSLIDKGDNSNALKILSLFEHRFGEFGDPSCLPCPIASAFGLATKLRMPPDAADTMAAIPSTIHHGGAVSEHAASASRMGCNSTRWIL